jgi:formylglycine-generating enzyme required for sulfatase activity
MLLAAIVMHLPVQAQPREAVFNGYCHSFRFLVGTASSAGLNFDMLFTSYDGKASIPLFDKDSSGYAIFSDEVMPSFGEPGVYRTDYVLYVNNNYNAAGTISATLPTVDTDQNGIADFLQKNQQGNLAISGKLLRQVPSLAPEIAISGQLARSAGTSQGTYSIGGRDPEIGDITYKGNLYLVNLIGKLKYNRTNNTATVEADLDREGGAVIKYTNQLNYSVSDTNTISFPSGKFSATNQLDVLHKAFILKRSGNRYIGRLDFEDAYKGTSWADYTAWQLEIVDTNDSDGDGVPDLSDPPAIQTPPTIVLQPVSQTRAVGEAVDLRVQAVGTGLLSYAWKKNGVPVLNLGGVSGANASTLSFASVQPSQAGNYSVVVSNAFGMVTSAVATLSIKVAGVAPAIVAQPQPVTVPAGQMAVFTVVATGTEPLGYQWQRNGINLPGANASTLTINQPQAVDAGDYRVVVSNAAGSVTSSIAKLIVEGSQTTSRASAVAVIRGGLVSSVTVTDGGGGYVSEPSVSLNGGGGTGATAKAFIENGRVVAIVVLNSGSGYTGTPTVTIDAPSKSLGLKIELIPKLTVEGPVGQSALVEWAGDLMGPWTAWSNVVVGTEGTVLVDLAPGATGRFYRAKVDAKPTGPDGFVWIPPGTFVMGSPASEANRSTNEVQHTVTLTQGFWMSDHETTQAEYQIVTGSNPSLDKGPNIPATVVTWEAALLYCQKLTERERAAGRITTQQAYRLPTEAEWEYAARAGTTGPYYGDLDGIAWYSGNRSNRVHSVKEKVPNAWGLYDMLGNVAEWCSDWYGDYSIGSTVDPTGPISGTSRVIRGGATTRYAGAARSAARNSWNPATSFLDIGFRPILSSVPGGTVGFVWIPPGTFVMGSPANEPDRSIYEWQHLVTLTQGFWMSDHETTQAEYQAVVGKNPSNFKGDTLPVEQVSWDDAVLYCQKLTERERAAGRITTQQAYRLPTEAEWEYAARAGTTGARYGELDAIAWWSGNSGNQTRPVKGKQANAWGLFDMIGNVWEWCADWYGDYPTGSVTDPAGPNLGSHRSVRGSGWGFDAGFARSAWRSRIVPGNRDYLLGFRPVLSSVR